MEIPHPSSSAPFVPEYGRPTKQSWSGRGIMAMGLTMLIPGLGQFAAGRTRRGLIWFFPFILLIIELIAAAVWPAFVPTAIIAIVVSELVVIASWIDAFRIGARSDRPMLGARRTRFLLGIMAAVIGLLGLPTLPIALCVRQFLCEAFVVPTASMVPTLAVGDRFLVHKRVGVSRWSVLAFHAPFPPGEVYVKRVVALPGETIEIIDGMLLINDQPMLLPSGMLPLNSTRLPIRNAAAGHPLTLKADEYFVIGDNGPQSYDSRFWPAAAAGHSPGAVPAGSVVGVGTYIYWPVGRWKKLY